MVVSSSHRGENAVKKFISQYSKQFSGIISCFDRMVFRGHLAIGWADAMERFLSGQGVRIMDFKRFVTKHSERIREHAEAVAARSGRPFLYLNDRQRKEDLVRGLAEKDGITEGLVC